MKRLQRLIGGIVLGALLCGPVVNPSFAASRTHPSSSHSHKKSNRQKTVHVKSYKKKNGTAVRSHDRSAPQPH